jgi:hypothetical protein
MITVEDVLSKMMRVPKRGADTLVSDIDAFLRSDNAEFLRALAIARKKVPPEARDYVDYMSTNYHKGKWRHSFIVHYARRFGVTRRFYHVPCLMPVRHLPTVSITVKYHDPFKDCNYMQNASFNCRARTIEIEEVIRIRSGGFDEKDVVLEIADETERLH